ncbi:DNA polymerase III subunit beta [Thermincola ferriacetica]|uniref:Beta sliding clamp n=1 Tax=Thermincola ferriacetica TaxID=281456 RepID=A0A0L6VZD8_9FIRM|nr:DNA polymerase III subunit beta [Thermincola ferriacetica]KNZ68498.1 DNA polymerase III subunit beta [Thermincola ferriacetica]
MEFTSNKNNMVYGVQVAQRAVSPKNPLPILSGILMKLKNNNLCLTATDLELGIECTVPVNGSSEGSVVLPAKYLSEIVRKLPDVLIEFSVEKENNVATLKYAQSKTTIHGYPADEFPLLPSLDGETTYVIKQELFKNMIKQVTFATAADENRPIFTGVLFEVEGDELRLVATDTHRLALRIGAIGSHGYSGEKTSALIPAKALNEIVRIMPPENEEVKIIFSNNQVVMELDNIRLISRLIEGQFPNYKQVIPQGCKSKIRLNTREFLDAVERASLLAKDGSNVIRLAVQNHTLIINSNSPDIGTIHEELPIVLEGEETQIAFNSKYLIDVLRVIDAEEVFLELTGSLSPGIVKPVEGDNYLYLILPVRTV